jgi:hypothetical protein
MADHDYSLHGGLNRAKVGRYLTLIAASISAGIIFVLLSLVDIAHRYNLNVNLPPSVLSLVGASIVFTVLYWILNRFAWRWPLLNKALKVPDLAGEWQCIGQTIQPGGAPGYQWEATVTIFQSWDKIAVRLKTKQSGSESIAAALICDDLDGCRLLYNYRNDPRIDEVELRSHVGSCMFLFSKDLKSAQGEYFNGHGRFTFGTMKLSR